MSRSTNAKDNIFFENTLTELLIQLGLEVKCDKAKMMNIDRVDTDKFRRDGTRSTPDAVALVEGKIIVLDAKNHHSNKITNEDVLKLVGDAKARNGERPILVIRDDGCLQDKAYETCKRHGIVIVKLEKGEATDGNSHPEITKGEYFNKTNLVNLKNAIDVQVVKQGRHDILITKDGKIDKRSHGFKADEIEILVKEGYLKLDQNGKVDPNCPAAKDYKEYHTCKENIKNATNYNHDQAVQDQKARSKEKREAKKSEGSQTVNANGKSINQMGGAEERKLDESPRASKIKDSNEVKQALENQARLAKEKESEKREIERQEAERRETQKREAERKEAQWREAERKEYERKEAERQQAARREAERKESERREAQRREAERIEAQRREAERREAERREYERQQAVKREAERREAERREAERREYERQQEVRRQAERNSSYGSNFGYSGSYGHSSYTNVSSNPTGSLRMDGGLDMRSIGNREVAHMKADGTPDMRFKCNW